MGKKPDVKGMSNLGSPQPAGKLGQYRQMAPFSWEGATVYLQVQDMSDQISIDLQCHRAQR